MICGCLMLQYGMSRHGAAVTTHPLRQVDASFLRNELEDTGVRVEFGLSRVGDLEVDGELDVELSCGRTELAIEVSKRRRTGLTQLVEGGRRHDDCGRTSANQHNVLPTSSERYALFPPYIKFDLPPP